MPRSLPTVERAPIGASSSRAAIDPNRDDRARVRKTRAVRLSVVSVLLGLTMLPPLLVARGRILPLPSILMAIAVVVVFATLTIWNRLPHTLSKGTWIALGALVSVAMTMMSGALFVFGATHLEVLQGVVDLHDPVRSVSFPPAAGAFIAMLCALLQVALWSVTVVVPEAYEDQRLKGLEIANLRLEAAELRTAAELARLRSQLEPHFLLNTLNLISGLVTIDPGRARHVLGSLGELLRDALRGGEDVQTVAEEVEWLRRYVEILESRHGDLLTVRWNVAEDALDAIVPRLILQPLVENAVQHGVLKKRGGGNVEVFVERRPSEAYGEVLVCEVRDDGGGGEVTRRAGGIGVENVRRRLELHAKGARFSLELNDPATVARIELPYLGARETKGARG